MMKLLMLDPTKRLTAEEALDHAWFWTSPLPAALEKTDLRVDSSHEMTTRKKEVPMPQQPPRQQFRPPPQQLKQWPAGPRNSMPHGGRDMGLGRPMPGIPGVPGMDMGRRPPAGPMVNKYNGPPGFGGPSVGPPMNGGMGHMPPQGFNNNPYGGQARPPPMGMQGGFPPNQPRTQPPPAPFALRTTAPAPPFALAGNNNAPPGFPSRAPYQQQPPYMQNGNGMKRQQPPVELGRDLKRPRGRDDIDHLPY